MIQLRTLKIVILDYLGGSSVITRVPKSREPFSAVIEGDVTVQEWLERGNVAGPVGGMCTASTSWEGKAINSPLEPPVLPTL